MEGPEPGGRDFRPDPARCLAAAAREAPELAEPLRRADAAGSGRARRVAAALALAVAGAAAAAAHDDEPRFARRLDWTTDQIVRAVAVRHTLGLAAHDASGRVVTVEGRRCVEAELVAFDVADEVAWDVDVPVELELLFAAPAPVTFDLAYDGNGTRGAPEKHMAAAEPGGGWHRATVHLGRARFADRGEHAVDLAIAASYAQPSPRGGKPARVPAPICRVGLKPLRAERPPAAFGGVELTLTDARTGRPVAARVGLYDETHRAPLPSGSSVLLRWFAETRRQLRLRPEVVWPAPNRWVFFVDGVYRARLPAGVYRLVAMKGPEYRRIDRQFEVAPAATRRITAGFERWRDMPGRGWYSGDTHLHTRRRDRLDDEAFWPLLAAEDLWVGDTLEMGNVERTYFEQRWGEEGSGERGGRLLVPGQEDPRTGRRGHMLALDLERPVRDTERYFLAHEVAEEVHRRGGLSGYAHVHRGWFNVFRGLALDLPFGAVDFVEILQGSRWGASMGDHYWYRYLNLGFKLAPTAGSDYPYVDLPGEVRSYVHVEGELNAHSWHEALRAGRTFVTNGPMLELTVEGRGMGEELRLERGATVRVRARAAINPDVGRLLTLDLIAHGEVIDRAAPERGAGSLALDTTLTVDGSQWLAVRARGRRWGRSAALAHSAPVYLIVDGAPFWHRVEVPRLIEWQLGQLDQLDDPEVEPRGVPEFWDTRDAQERAWRRQRPLLETRLAAARLRYLELRRRAEEPAPPAP